MKVVLATPVPAEKTGMFSSVPGVDLTVIDRTCFEDEAIRDAEVILGNLPYSRLAVCENLKWMQLDSAGANVYTDLPDSVTLTNASGAYGTAISEYMLAYLFFVLKKVPQYMELQSRHDYTNLGSVRTIAQLKVLCLGAGNIGSEFAKRVRALGAEVHCVRRTKRELPEYFKEQYTFDEMDAVLPEFDVIAMSLPGTKETEGFFGYDRLMKTKKNSILINVGRGSAIPTEDLIKAARQDHFAGIVLDVQEHEPLPKNNELWNLPNVYITPHISGRFNAEVTYDNVLEIFRTNLLHYVNGEPLEHVVDKKAGY